MTVDWERKADPEAVHETASVLRASADAGFERATQHGGLEGHGAALGRRAEGAAKARSEKERVERLNEAIATAELDPLVKERETIRREVVAGARSALAKAFEGEAPDSFTFREQVGLEAVILTNGERPSLFVKEGFVDLDAPDIGDWDWALRHHERDIRSVVESVGRIDVPVKPGFAGTCFVLAQGLVVTNRHVLEAIASQESDEWTLNWPGSTTVDFGGEGDAAPSTRFKVIGVAFAGPNPIESRIDFSHLDMAVLRVDPIGDKPYPEPVRFETDAAQPKAKHNIYVLGFPGRPRKWVFDGVPDAGYETSEVLAAIFPGKFGVKKLAPGVIKAGPGGVAGDTRGWICSHDASTLGGNSGSAVVDLHRQRTKDYGPSLRRPKS